MSQNLVISRCFLGSCLSRPKIVFHAQQWSFTVDSRSFIHGWFTLTSPQEPPQELPQTNWACYLMLSTSNLQGSETEPGLESQSGNHPCFSNLNLVYVQSVDTDSFFSTTLSVFFIGMDFPRPGATQFLSMLDEHKLEIATTSRLSVRWPVSVSQDPY